MMLAMDGGERWPGGEMMQLVRSCMQMNMQVNIRALAYRQS